MKVLLRAAPVITIDSTAANYIKAFIMMQMLRCGIVNDGDNRELKNHDDDFVDDDRK